MGSAYKRSAAVFYDLKFEAPLMRPIKSQWYTIAVTKKNVTRYRTTVVESECQGTNFIKLKKSFT